VVGDDALEPPGIRCVLGGLSCPTAVEARRVKVFPDAACVRGFCGPSVASGEGVTPGPSIRFTRPHPLGRRSERGVLEALIQPTGLMSSRARSAVDRGKGSRAPEPAIAGPPLAHRPMPKSLQAGRCLCCSSFAPPLPFVAKRF
jgi:hypothetical protein